jgi:hypothetical protein
MALPILRSLRDPSLAPLFWDLCEFAATGPGTETPGWFRLQSGEPLEVVGRDAGGGYFCLYRGGGEGEPRLLYVGSEGEAGVLARSLSEGLQMMIALPYWRDCLKFSGGGKLEEMRKAQGGLEASLRESRPDLDVLRQQAYAALGLTAPAAPVDLLHQAVTEGAGLQVVATSDGSPFGTLFSNFVI